MEDKSFYEQYWLGEEMRNPNFYITSDPMGGIWSSNVFPWQEVNPWTLNASG